ncbi:toxin CptA [Chromobacterium alkanivorans]|uniref:GGDEF domain-containing protein n=1 Tax=Chromobacterium TaxID=535 RepID=UPI00069F47BE|nr:MULTISPECIES: GGDEF domain-containing protein [Chromobacterium]MBN3004391.1 GGDEF domain-containing protein [Chromobacterium alkanivorans]MCS3805147.1 toxin CptA [Chromobacterium alkanivorans]MCS3819290.1 toxin CptA [Chromobacterium alkanivorans]MCS3873802.1 toxin CptA [Chromobacterium alkanivorans]
MPLPISQLDSLTMLHAMRSTYLSVPHALLGAALLIGLEWGRTPVVPSVLWLVLLSLLLLWQWGTTWRACRCPEHDDWQIAALYRRFAVQIVAVGVGWGAAAWILMPDGDLTYSLIVVLWGIAVSAVLGAMLSARRELFYGFVGPLWCLLLLRLFLSPEPVLRWVGVSGIIYCLSLMQFTSLLHRFALESMGQRAENASLMRELTLEQTQLDNYNAMLEQKNMELDGAVERISELASRDPLTGVLNMRTLMREMERLLELSETQGSPFAIAIIDLDHFKRVNDSCGHARGDEVLQQLCELAQQALADGELFGRYGGEEFLLLAPACSGAELSRRMEALRDKVGGWDWRRLTGDLPVTLSCGVAAWRPGVDPLGLLQQADKALYQAKALGRDRVCLAREAAA